jgi:DNA-binding LacI/PurR family transcriptional regulator
VKKAPTLKDVANRLGVSQEAVSKALRDAPDIGRELKAKVRATAKKMKYRPNKAAVALQALRHR